MGNKVSFEDVEKRMNDIFGSNAKLTLIGFDHEQAKHIRHVYKDAWDMGNSFVSVWGNFSIEKRSEDTQEEIDACARLLHNEYKHLVEQNYYANLSRDAAVHICNFYLLSPQLLSYPTIEIIPGITISNPYDFARQWNDIHPDENPITMPDPDWI